MTAARISNLSLARASAAVEETRERTRARERSVRSFVRSVRSVRRSVRRSSVRRALRALDRARRPLEGVESTRGRSRAVEAVEAVGAVGRRGRARRSVEGGRSVATRSRARYLHRRVVNGRALSLFVFFRPSIHSSRAINLLVWISAEWYYSRVRTHPWVPPPPTLLRGEDVPEGALSLCLHIRAKVNPKVASGNPARLFEGNERFRGRQVGARARARSARSFDGRGIDARGWTEREGERALASVARERRAHELDRFRLAGGIFSFGWTQAAARRGRGNGVRASPLGCER